VQVAPQLIPAGELVTVPLPVFDTLRVAGDAVMLNESVLEVPPPGVGFTTATVALPGDAMSAAATAIWSCPLLTYVVARLTPFHWMEEPGTKLLPLTARVNPDP